jgi:hypothetical protein
VVDTLLIVCNLEDLLDILNLPQNYFLETNLKLRCIGYRDKKLR